MLEVRGKGHARRERFHEGGRSRAWWVGGGGGILLVSNATLLSSSSLSGFFFKEMPSFVTQSSQYLGYKWDRGAVPTKHDDDDIRNEKTWQVNGLHYLMPDPRNEKYN